jgi:hypothetical protein
MGWRAAGDRRGTAPVPCAYGMSCREPACTYALRGMHPSELMGAEIRICPDFGGQPGRVAITGRDMIEAIARNMSSDR